MSQSPVTDSWGSLVFFLTRAGTDNDLRFSRHELQMATYLFKQRLPDDARERGIFQELQFDTNGDTPYSEWLEWIIDSWILSGVLISADDTRYQLHQIIVNQKCRDCQFNPDDQALLESLSPLFTECLNTSIARRGVTQEHQGRES